MFDFLRKAFAKTALVRRSESQLAESATKQPIVLSPRFQRILVVGPTVLLSLWLTSLGFPLVPRVIACMGVGTILILLVARHQRRARLY